MIQRIRAWAVDSPPLTRRQFLSAFTILFALITVALVVDGLIIRSNRHLAQRTNRSLCSLRGELEQRVARSEAFLDENPHGVPGITPATIRKTIGDTRRTVAALRELDCPTGLQGSRP